MVSVCPQTLGLEPCVWLLHLLVSLHVIARQGNAIRLCDILCPSEVSASSSQIPMLLYHPDMKDNRPSVEGIPAALYAHSRYQTPPALMIPTRNVDRHVHRMKPRRTAGQLSDATSHQDIDVHSGRRIASTRLNTNVIPKSSEISKDNQKGEEFNWIEENPSLSVQPHNEQTSHKDRSSTSLLQPSLSLNSRRNSIHSSEASDVKWREIIKVFKRNVPSTMHPPVDLLKLSAVSRGMIMQEGGKTFVQEDSKLDVSNNYVVTSYPSTNTSELQEPIMNEDDYFSTFLLTMAPVGVINTTDVNKTSEIEFIEEYSQDELSQGLMNSTHQSSNESSTLLNDTHLHNQQLPISNNPSRSTFNNGSLLNATSVLKQGFPLRPASRDVVGKAVFRVNVLPSTERAMHRKPPPFHWRPFANSQSQGHGGIRRSSIPPPSVVVTAPPTVADVVVRASMSKPLTLSGDVQRPKLTSPSITAGTILGGAPGYRPLEDAVDELYKRKELLGDSSDRGQDWRASTSSSTSTFSDTFEKPGYFVVLRDKDGNAPVGYHPGGQGLRVIASTFFPHSLREIAVKFGDDIGPAVNKTSSDAEEVGDPEAQDDDDGDDDDDSSGSKLTTEKLAYVLIGTCCGLSIFCLMVVAVTMRCRKKCLQRRLKRRFQAERLYGETIPGIATKWQSNQLYGQYPYMQRGSLYVVPNTSTCSSTSCPSCRCRCVTWSLGPRNLDTKPFCSNQYQRGPRKLPFGAASTLQFEATYPNRGRNDYKRSTTAPSCGGQMNCHDGDSLEDNSGSDSSFTSRQCTCVEPNHPPTPGWEVPTPPLPPPPSQMEGQTQNSPDSSGEVDRRWRRQDSCSRQPMPCSGQQGSRDCPPPPVSGSSYLQSANGVVFWSSNDERLI